MQQRAMKAFLCLLLAGCAPQGATSRAGEGDAIICAPAGKTGNVTVCNGPKGQHIICAPAGVTGTITICR
jgi:hypothetical protein